MKELLTDPKHRFARRLVMMLLWLVLFDRIALNVLRTAERERYEGTASYRFTNNDLFSLGPLARYLREHPQGERRRLVFMGNSVLFGYSLKAPEAIPGQYERQAGDARVLNAAFNGAEVGSSYLVAKAILGSVDGIFVQIVGDLTNPHLGKSANPLLGSLIPIDEKDVRAFHLDRPHPVEQHAKASLSRVWRLYDVHERLQAALFGTSTRQYLYVHKKDILRRLLRPFRASVTTPPPPPESTLTHSVLRAPRAADPRATGVKPGILADFGELARSHRKRIVLIVFERDSALANDDEIGVYNAHYAPYAEIVVIRVPRELTWDAQHLTVSGGRDVAAQLLRHERQRAQEVAAR